MKIVNASKQLPTTPIKDQAGRQHYVIGRVVLIMFAFLLIQSCIAYAPVPAPVVYRVSSYRIAWESAQGAAEDAGIRITYADEASGTIEGEAGRTTVTIMVIRLPEERIRLEVSLRGPSRDTFIADEFHRAYERRVGRR
jgi:hypothetical protein